MDVTRVSDASSLINAICGGRTKIEVAGSIAGLKSLRLPAGTRLSGATDGAELRFEEGQPGLILSAGHEIRDLRLVTDETQIALGLADDADDLGTIVVSDVTSIGRVHLEGSRAKAGDIRLDRIHVERADARMAAHRPAGFGVEVLLGGITVYNTSKDAASRWTLEARDLSGGSREAPLRGSGVFVFGGWFIPDDADMGAAPAPTQHGGSIALSILSTGEVHSNGGIPRGVGDLITGGVFVGSGVHAAEVVNDGATTTYGPNDMVLDNWGKVDAWTARAPVTSLESSGIGFVNFGDIASLEVAAPIVTHGLGARGFNLYDGSLQRAEFQSITTYGDGAIGIQLSRPFGTLVVHGDVRTEGGEGDSLVRGKVVHLKAHAVSLKPGTKGNSITIGGTAEAANPNVPNWDFQTPAELISLITIAGLPMPPSV